MNPESRQRFSAYLAALATAVFWGFSYISTKTLLATLSPFQVAAGRFWLASLIILSIGLATKTIKPVARRDWPRLFLAGFSGIFTYFIFENSGLRLTTAGMGSLIIATIPVLNLLFSTVIMKRRISWGAWIGVFLSLLGVSLIIRAGAQFALNVFWGNLLVLGAAASWVAYTQLNQPLSERYDSFSLNLYQTLVGTALLTLIALGEGRSLPPLTPGIGLNLLFLAVCCSALAYIFYLYALRRLGATVVTTFINFIPVFGVLGGILILGEPFGVDQLAGGLVILTGVFLVSRSGQKTGKRGENADRTATA